MTLKGFFTLPALVKRAVAPVASFLGRLARLVSGPRELGRTGMVMASLLVGSLIFVGLFYVWTRMQLVQIGYEIAALEKENKALKKRKEELLLEVASLQSPQELEKKARKQAGLVFPDMGKVVHVR